MFIEQHNAVPQPTHGGVHRAKTRFGHQLALAYCSHTVDHLFRIHSSRPNLRVDLGSIGNDNQ